MENKVFISVFVLYLGFSSIIFSDAVPMSRSLKSFRADYFNDQNLLAQVKTMRTWGMLSVKHGRMGLEIMDYSDPGANNDHDPKTPPSKV